MRPRTIVSMPLLACLFAATVLGQPPTGAPPGTDPGTKKAGGERKSDPADAAVAAALANDPDVKVARAKVQLAEAELAKAKQGVVLKVLTLKAAIEEHKRTLAAAEDRYAWTERMVKQGVGENRLLLEERAKLETAKAALARAETELKLLTGGGGKELGAETGTEGHAETVTSALRLLMSRSVERDQAAGLLSLLAERHAIKGPIPDRIRAALDKPVKLGVKGDRVKFDKALDVFKKEAGLDVPVRGPIEQVGTITSDGEELPVGAWFQLFEDHTFLPVGNPDPNASFGGRQRKGRLYVREYGILLAPVDAAPADAPTLTEFWKQKPPSAKKEPAPEPKPQK
jgi:hypothetical protein